jgi:hypothetical protein
MATTIPALIAVENSINELYKQKVELIKRFMEENPNNFAGFQNPDGTWTRVTSVDNKEAIEDGFYKIVRVDRFSVKIETLKNMPKELKEVKG